MLSTTKRRGSCAKFSPGEKVQVRGGAADPDHPQMLIGGFAGVVVKRKRSRPRCYQIRWSEETLGILHPRYRNLRPDDTLWLDEADLLPAPSPDGEAARWRRLGDSPLPQVAKGGSAAPKPR